MNIKQLLPPVKEPPIKDEDEDDDRFVGHLKFYQFFISNMISFTYDDDPSLVFQYIFVREEFPKLCNGLVLFNLLDGANIPLCKSFNYKAAES